MNPVMNNLKSLFNDDGWEMYFVSPRIYVGVWGLMEMDSVLWRQCEQIEA